jgi:hypothetical protein
MRKCTVISSLVSNPAVTQAGIVYLLTGLQQAGYAPQLIDLSGTIDYFDAPAQLYSKCTSQTWMNPGSIRRGEWMDEYLPPTSRAGEVNFFSSTFSPDLVFHARYSHLIKKNNPAAVTVVGGSALAGLRDDQLEFLASFFDYVFVGHDVNKLLSIVSDSGSDRHSRRGISKAVGAPCLTPDYSLVPLNQMAVVYSGHGCYYGKCRFCDYPSRASKGMVFRAPMDVAEDMKNIHKLHPTIQDITLSQDCYGRRQLLDTTHAIGQFGGDIPYNLMLRAEPWISDAIGELLEGSGCTDVFIGAEALSDDVLSVLNKGLLVSDIKRAVRVLSRYVDITIGLILFVPGVSEESLCTQLDNIEELRPYLTSIEPEVLTVVNGSGFANDPSRYGIVLNATDNLLNDSWCFGLSQDIPWKMKDRKLLSHWFSFAGKLRELCSDQVKPHYWDAIDRLHAQQTYSI